MRKKLLAGFMCVAMAATMFGCGKEEKEKRTDEVTTGQTQETEQTVETGEEDRILNSVVMSIDYSEEAVLPAPENAYLFEEKLLLPIKTDALLDYQVSSNEHVNGDDSPIKTHKLSEEIEESTGTLTYPDFVGLLYDKSYTSVADEGGVYMPAMTIGKDGQEKTMKEFADANVWVLDQKIGYSAAALGLSEDEKNEMQNAAGIENDEEFCIKELINRFGNPNYLTFYLKGVDEQIDGVLHTDKKDSGIFISGSAIGWFFEDYKIIVMITETVQMKSDGSHNCYISEANLYYYPAEYGDITEEFGENMVSEFIQKRKQAVGDVAWYQPVKTEFEAVEQPATEATTEAEESAEEATATDSGIIGGPVGNSEDSGSEE